MFTIEYKKNPTMSYLRKIPSFFFYLHQGMITNEHQNVTNMALSVSMEGLWGDFIAIFWIVKYLQRSIYAWNKISKHSMS
jgi:hypothetical protein